VSWPTVPLGDIFQIARGGSPRPIDNYITDDADGVNWVSIRDASNSSKFITKTEKKIRPAGVAKSRMVYPGDFLLTNSMSFGRPYILQTTGCIHDGWLVLSSDKSVVDQDFFYHLLGSEVVYKKFAKLAAGAVVKNLNCDLVKTVKVPLPPLPEQRRIAAILDKADALRAKRRAAIAKLDQLLQSMFLDMFGDPVTNPKNWPTVALSDVTTKIGSGATPTGGDESYKKEGIALIRSMNVHDGKFRWAKIAHIDKEQAQKLRNVVVEFDDVLLNITGASVARVCRAPIAVLPARVNQHVAIIRCGSLISPTYLEYALMSPPMKAKLLRTAESGATRQAITKAEIEKIVVALPPIDKQKEFAHVAERASGQIDKGQKSSQRIEALFATLQSQVFGA
jgi:type I restriction enzyme S subunit